MIFVDILQKDLITRLSLFDILRRMMDDDTIHLSCLLDRPDESMTILCSLGRYSLLSIWKEYIESFLSQRIGRD